jgi:hypothetical protein
MKRVSVSITCDNGREYEFSVDPAAVCLDDPAQIASAIAGIINQARAVNDDLGQHADVSPVGKLP